MLRSAQRACLEARMQSCSVLDGGACRAMLGAFPPVGGCAMPNITPIDVATVRRWLGDGGEVAFIDVREDGQHGAGHPLLAVSLPYSRLELGVGQLVPRRSCRVVLIDDGDGVADKAARRLAGLGYGAVHVLEGGIAAWSAK